MLVKKRYAKWIGVPKFYRSLKLSIDVSLAIDIRT